MCRAQQVELYLILVIGGPAKENVWIESGPYL